MGVDLTVIIASITLTIIASSQNKHKNFAAAAFRGLRFFQILRMLRVDRRAGTWRLLGMAYHSFDRFTGFMLNIFIFYFCKSQEPLYGLIDRFVNE